MKTNAKQLIIRQKNIITQVKCPQLPNIFRVKLIKFQDNDKSIAAMQSLTYAASCSNKM